MIYVFYGKEPLQKREALDALKARLDTDGALAMNTTVLDARQAGPQEVMAACDTIPFLAEARLVVLENLLRSARRRGAPDAEEDEEPDAPVDLGPWGALVDYADRIPPTTTLVILGGDVMGTNPLIKAFLKKGATIEHFSSPKLKQLPEWVSRRAQSIGLKIDARATKLLAELVGEDLWLLAGELEKLKTYAAGAAVREQDVRELVSQAREEKAWTLADAIVEGQVQKATRVLHELYGQEQHPGAVLANVQARFRALAIARDMLDHGESGTAIGQRLRRQGYGLEVLIEQAQKLPLSAIRRAYRRLVQAESDVRRGIADADISVELAVQDLAGTRAA